MLCYLCTRRNKGVVVVVTLFMAKTAEKLYPLGPHIAFSYLSCNLTVWDTVSPFAIDRIILCCGTPKQNMTSICTFSVSYPTISEWEYTCCAIGIATDG